MKRANISYAAYLVAFMFLSGCDNGNASATSAETRTSQITKPNETNQHDDMGKKPWVLDIEEATLNNPHYRIARWSGGQMQMVLMSLKPGEEIELEMHDGVDQFIRIEQGEAHVRMGRSQNDLSYDKKVSDDWAVFIPSGYWHHIKNIGTNDLKLYTIYTPPQHSVGTLHKTHEEARMHHEEDEH